MMFIVESGETDTNFLLTEHWRKGTIGLLKNPKTDNSSHTWAADSTFGGDDSFSTISQSGSVSGCVLDTSSASLITSSCDGSRTKAWYISRWPFTRDLALSHKTDLQLQTVWPKIISLKILELIILAPSNHGWNRKQESSVHLRSKIVKKTTVTETLKKVGKLNQLVQF